MPVRRTYECPDCGGRFQHLHMRADEAPPIDCPICGNSMTDEPAVRPGAPAIATRAGKAGDEVYRAMEAGAEHRAQMMGNDALRMTDLKGGTVAGETAYVPPVNQSGLTGNMHGGEAVSAYAAAVNSGPSPRAGSKALDFVTRMHRSGGRTH